MSLQGKCSLFFVRFYSKSESFINFEVKFFMRICHAGQTDLRTEGKKKRKE